MTTQGTSYELRIIRGLPKVPNDTVSAEEGLTTLNFINTGAGFSVDPNAGYVPQRPTVKNGGLWADSALVNGRTLIASAETNVTETIKSTLHASSLIAMNALIKQLEFMIKSVNDFWTSEDQIEPVYLMNQVPGEPGARYALLYSIEVTYEDPDALETPQRDVTISIEREPYWRPIPPGANPKLWTFYMRDGDYGAFNTNTAGLLSGTDAYVFQTVQNRREWQPGQNALYSQNYIDIPAENIPGDAPALVCMGVSTTITSGGVGAVLGALHLANTINPTSLPIRGSGNRALYNILNAGDNDSVSNFTISTSVSYPISNNQTTGQRAVSTAAGCSILWRAGESVLDTQVFRGTYAVFLRADLNAATITAQVETSRDASVLFAQQSIVTTGLTGSGIQTYYIGRLTIPADTRTSMDADGRGVMVTPTSNPNLTIRLTTTRTASVNQITVADLVLIPVDREYTRVLPIVNGEVDTGANMLLDNTGYLDHGASEYHVTAWVVASTTISVQNPEIQGNMPVLYPGYDNRLYFLIEQGAHQVRIADSAAIRINIVPRWTGLRDR